MPYAAKTRALLRPQPANDDWPGVRMPVFVSVKDRDRLSLTERLIILGSLMFAIVAVAVVMLGS